MRNATPLLAVIFHANLALGGQTPAPTFAFDTGTGPTETIYIGGIPADANVAASHTHVCVTARDALACFTKAGGLVGLGPGLAPTPMTESDFFTTLSSGAVSPGSASSGGTPAKDGRIVFDPKRKRFLVAFQTRTQHPQLLIAASRSEDPRDGWFTFADNVEGSNLPNVTYQGQDYMWIGINGSSLMISNNMFTCTGSYATDSWKCKFLRTRHFSYPLSTLTSGAGAPAIAREEWFDDTAGNNAAPCIDDSSSTDAFWVHRDDDSHVTVWGRRNGHVTKKQVKVKKSEDTVNGSEITGGPVRFDNINRNPTNAECRNGKIVFVSNDGHKWLGLSHASNVIRLVRLDVTHFFDASPSVAVELDRMFGRSSPGDAAGLVYDYGWPAVSTNAGGDIVVGSVRTMSAMWPELRASVWFAGQPDISGSASLQPSLGPLPIPEFHMAGAAADPSTSGVYLAQQFGTTAGPFRIHVAKMLGKLMPDLIATAVQPQETSVKPGAAMQVLVTIVNQGDGPMPESAAELKLSNSNAISATDYRLLIFNVPPLAPGEEFNNKYSVTIPATYAPAKYFVGLVLDIKNVALEYSESNNMNPFLNDDHGKAPINVQ